VVVRQAGFVELDDVEVPDKASSVGSRAVGPGRQNEGSYFRKKQHLSK